MGGPIFVQVSMKIIHIKVTSFQSNNKYNDNNKGKKAY